MWTQPLSFTSDLISFSKSLGATWIGLVDVDYFPNYLYDNCHNNVLDHISMFGGTRRLCYYIVECDGIYQAIYHSIWQDDNGKLLDITPYADGRNSNLIAILPEDVNCDYSIPNCYSSIVERYLSANKYEEYYVYSLNDPETKEPFYIGKGKGDRAKHHLLNLSKSPNTYKQNKINSIRKKGLEPLISYLSVNILDEDLAYTLEEKYILFYGRKGYEKNGILTNVCLGASPPNHKGKSYEEIYGKEKAKQQRAMRSTLQKERGGYGPKKFSQDVKDHLSLINKGKGNPRFGVKVAGTATADKISKANKGKKHYNRKDIKILYIDGLDIFLYSNDLKSFCIEHNLSEGTFKKQLRENWPRSKKGKNKNLLIRLADKNEINNSKLILSNKYTRTKR